MFIELLIVLFIDLVATIGMVPTLLVCIVFLVLATLAAQVIARWLTDAILGTGRSGANRPGRSSGAERKRMRREKKIWEMGEEELRAWLERHPADSTALGRLGRLLKQRGDIEAYALIVEQELAVRADLSTEESCMRHHQLADILVRQLGRPDRAREVLETFISIYPHSSQATLTRERMRNLDAEADPPGPTRAKPQAQARTKRVVPPSSPPEPAPPGVSPAEDPRYMPRG